MNSLHSIPKEIEARPFGLSDDQIKMIRAYKSHFYDGGVAVWLRDDGVVVDIGWDNRDGHEPSEPPEFIPWRSTQWLTIFNEERREYPEFNPSWIVGVLNAP